MRARNLKPGFFKNEALADLPFEARLLFQGLWCLADRNGRLEDRPKRVKAEVFPYDGVNVEDLLGMLATHGFIIRYEANNDKYIEIKSFTKHQHPHFREQPGAIPGPALGQPQSSLSLARLTPSSLTPHSLKPHITSNLPVRHWFDLLWQKYPRRDGRKLAERSFYASVKTEQDWKDIQQALSHYISSEVVKKGYIKNGSTWFGNWRDWIQLSEVKENGAIRSQSISEQAAERHRAQGSERIRDQNTGPKGLSQPPSAGTILAGIGDMRKIQSDP